MYYTKEISEIVKDLNINNEGLTPNEVLDRQKNMVKIYYLKRKR